MALRVDQSAVEAGATVSTDDLYADGFDPVLGRDEYFRRFSFDPLVQKYTEEIEAAERIVVIHPDWWGHLPAMAKGWVDRVLRPGVAYEYSGNEFLRKERAGLLTGKRVMVFSTSDAAHDEDHGMIGTFWHGVFSFCGVDETEVHRFYGFHDASGGERTRWLDEVSRHVTEWLAED